MKNYMHEVKLRVPREDIYYISWNIDACEGVGLLRTDDAKEGAVTVFTPVSQLRFLFGLVDGHRAEGMEITIENIKEVLENMDE